MNLATLDIGTNSVLLLVATISDHGDITTLEYETRIPRLGRGVDAQRRLHPDSIARVVEVIKEYAQIIRRHNVRTVVVAGTSAVRDSANADELSHAIEVATGCHLEVLSGSEEAIWTYRGAISGIRSSGTAAVIDIGGGSTEITVGTHDHIDDHCSMNIGSVRLTERFFQHDPPTTGEIARAREFTREQLAKALHFTRPDLQWVGVAGTATTLAVMVQGKADFVVADISNMILHRHDVDRVFEKISVMPAKAIRSLSNVLEGRADVITAGAMVLQEAMECLHFTTLTVSERGLRYGLALRTWEREGRIENGERRMGKLRGASGPFSG